ncbi:MAG TPA: tripartite tricarboxylate transporter substrate binding protein [Rhodanobacteraceae bacterium]|nr:tripartite tricarboxylate transporter substrate binding protein [Rhodanobacteraceae bacterium]
MRQLCLILGFAAGAAVAQPYPSHAIRLIIPAGPGGGVDTISRALGTPLGAALGQPVVMDNRPGAGTMLASELAAKAPPDGYTLLMVTNSHAIDAGIRKNLPFDPVNDFAYVSLVASLPYWIVVHPSVPATNVRELIALARKRPGELYFASAGTGSGTHLAFALFEEMAGIKALHVPYKSGSAALVDLAGGHVQLMASNTINSRPYVLAKKLRALAITSKERSALYPQLPTVAESGVSGYQADAWYGLVAPAKTPAEIVAQLNRELVAILKTGDAREKLASQGADVIGSTSAQFAQVMKRDIEKWARVTARLRLQSE